MCPYPSRHLGLLFGCLIVVTGCQSARDFLPRTHTTSVSPDGRHSAFVRQGFNLDPPDDHLFLTTRGRPTRTLMDLAADADWCKTIVWSADSRKVGFVVTDDRLALFDVDTGRLEAFFFLAGSGCCGGPQEARNVALTDDGTEVSFNRFDRAVVLGRSKDGKDFEAAVTREWSDLAATWPLLRPAKDLGREVVRVPVSRVRVRLVAAPGDGVPSSISVRVVLKDQRWIEVPATPARDGLVVLTPVDDGPIDRLEIGAAGLGGKRIVVHGVRGGGDATAVNMPARSAG